MIKEKEKLTSIPDRSEDLLIQSMKAFDEIRRKTLVLSRYRDTDVLAQDIDDLLKEIKKSKQDGK